MHASRHGSITVIDILEPLTSPVISTLADGPLPAAFAGANNLVLELKQMPLIDSAGLEWLLDLRDRLKPQGGLIKLANLNPLCQDIFRATGVAEEFEIFSDTTRAIASFSR